MAQAYKNRIIRAALLETDTMQYELADAIGLHESGVSRTLRAADLSDENQLIVADFIRKLKKGKVTEVDRNNAKMALTSLSVPSKTVLLYETFGTANYLQVLIDMKHEITALQDEVRYLETAVRRRDYTEEY